MRTTWLWMVAGCAGMERGCSAWEARSFGADWVVVQMDTEGRPFRCWELHRVSISNEQSSDGIYWVDAQSGNLVHISGLYNSVQVINSRWDAAFAEVGLTRDSCKLVHDSRYDPATRTFQLP
jgi:hypothetical protein